MTHAHDEVLTASATAPNVPAGPDRICPSDWQLTTEIVDSFLSEITAR